MAVAFIPELSTDWMKFSISHQRVHVVMRGTKVTKDSHQGQLGKHSYDQHGAPDKQLQAIVSHYHDTTKQLLSAPHSNLQVKRYLKTVKIWSIISFVPPVSEDF